MSDNYYIRNVGRIAQLSYKRGVDWSVAVDLFDEENGGVQCDESQIGALRGEFYTYVRDRRYDEEGNEIN